MAGVSGVFIRCSSSKDRECLKELQRLMKPETFHGVKRDDTHGGLKVFFKNASIVRNILREQYLFISGDRFSLHPLTTTLIVQTDSFDFSDDFEEVLRNGLKHLGPVLKISRINMFDEIPNAFTGDWKVVVDVPEIEDLIQNGLSNNMTVSLPGFDKVFQVTFCCSYCDKDGHTLSNCPETGNVQDRPEFQAVTQSSRIDSVSSDEVKEPASSSNQRGFEFRIRDPEETMGAGKKPTILPNDIKSWASKIGEEKVRQELLGHSFDSSATIKSESGYGLEDRLSSKKRGLDGDEYQSPSKHSRIRTVPHIATPFGRFFPFPSTSKADDVEVIYDGNLSVGNTNEDNTSTTDSVAARKPSNQEDAGQVPTSSRPEEAYGLVKSELPSTDENDSDSNQGGPATPAAVHQASRRRKPAQNLQIKIPEGIKTIIFQNPGILSAERLEAFFNHVKKKSSPCMVANNFTDNVEGLKSQLQGIKDRYYNTPIIHSAEEKYFMKWFENVLARFDRKPTRKPRN